MLKLNENFLNLQAGYLFPEIARRVSAHQAAHPEADVIKLGIGDVTEPLPPAVTEAMAKAVAEMADASTFHGYGPALGYDWLRQAFAEHDFQSRGCDVSADEVFVSDGSKCDAANILDIFGAGNRVAVCDPVYPVYVDTNVMAGNAGPPKPGDDSGRYSGLVYLPMTADNGFVPEPPPEDASAPPLDLVYLCSPNNPTGAAATKDELAAWVAYANRHGSILLYDAAYADFIQDPSLPRSIYEIEGARDCAIEMRSLSKTAGFTGTRCGYVVIPKTLERLSSSGQPVSLHALWSRRQSTKFNSVGYVVQRGAEAVYTAEGRTQCKSLIDGYMANAAAMRTALTDAGLAVYGGENAPYVWVGCPDGADSWGFFDQLLTQAHVVGTPGAGFGSCGEGYIRFSAFNDRAKVDRAMSRVVGQLGALSDR